MTALNPLVSTQWLHDHLHDSNLRVIDIRGHVLPAGAPLPHYYSHRADYDANHIPGALFVDWTRDITDPDSPNGTQIARPDVYAALMSRLGVGADTFVVAYDDAGGMLAARLWWTLNVYGHTQAAVLDGGWTKWTAENRPVTAEVPDVTPAIFTPRYDPTLRRTIDQVQAALEKQSTALLDVRTVEEFTGQTSRARRMGHIPGALNFPRAQMLAPDSTLLPLERLRARFTELKLNNHDGEIIVYCNSGASASFGLLALRAAGITNATVYDGSWKEWGNDEARPIA